MLRMTKMGFICLYQHAIATIFIIFLSQGRANRCENMAAVIPRNNRSSRVERASREYTEKTGVDSPFERPI